jgi:threonine/homoserine/homoserine lactone efflux protein
MDILNIVAKGFVIGLIIGMPMGPVGALVIQRVLIYGKKVGLISGLGSTFADMIYAIIAAFRITFISSLLTENQRIIQIVGGAVVFAIGIRIFKRGSL